MRACAVFSLLVTFFCCLPFWPALGRQQQRSLKGTSWIVTAISAGEKNGPTTASLGDDVIDESIYSFQQQLRSVSDDDTIAILSFQESGGMLNANFQPCHGVELVYYTDDDDPTGLRITDISQQCPECTPPSDFIKYCDWDATAFLDALFRVASYSVVEADDDEGAVRLELRDAQGSTVLELLSCRGESDLADTAWHPVVIYDEKGEEALRPLDVVDRRSIYAKFERCSFYGSDTCNYFGGVYKTLEASNKLLIGGVSKTLVLCEGPSTEIKNAYNKALGGVAAYNIASDKESLKLLDADGKELVGFVPCAEAAITDGLWLATFIQNSRSTAQFGTDDILRGNTACREYEMKFNSYANGSIAIDIGDQAPFGTADCDRKAFKDEWQYKNAIEQETKYLDALDRARNFDIVLCTDSLVLRDEQGNSLVRFARFAENEPPSSDSRPVDGSSGEEGDQGMDVAAGESDASIPVCALN